ncbi:hypothetical protein KCP77_11310 [Salmonella enterica subsp. enterica]|nr:hypothetical protein KCP77_11310 [Salmonella enterica subsp. enterica]
MTTRATPAFSNAATSSSVAVHAAADLNRHVHARDRGFNQRYSSLRRIF